MDESCQATQGALDSARCRAAGKKVIACASGQPSAGLDEPSRGLAFAGLLTFVDPIRMGVAEAIASCRAAGVRVQMVTGDHVEAAREVASRIRVCGDREPRVISGDDLLDMISRRGPQSAREVDVIARAMPQQKLALVRALREVGEVVAVTGDGVNDVPALQAADVGIAMGQRGTQSARDAASIVLLDDRFESIAMAVREGRRLFGDLQRSFQYLLMVHIPLVLTATLIPLAGYPLLFLPIYVVWLEAVIHPTALLAFQGASRPADEGGPRTGFFTPIQWISVAAVGVLSTIILVATWDRSLGPQQDVEHARAMAIVVLTAVSAAVTIALSRLRSTASRLLPPLALGGALLLVQAPALARVVHVRPLHVDDLAIAVLAAVLAASPALVSWRRGTGGTDDATRRWS